jgi:hypothetical protein
MAKKISRVYNEAENRAYPVVDKEARAALEAKVDRSDFANSGWIDEFSFNSECTEFDVPYFDGGAFLITATTINGDTAENVATQYVHIGENNTRLGFIIDGRHYTITYPNGRRKISITADDGSTYHDSLDVLVICGYRYGWLLKAFLSPYSGSGLEYENGMLKVQHPAYMLADGSLRLRSSNNALKIIDNEVVVPIGAGLKYDSTNKVLTLWIGNGLEFSGNTVKVKLESNGAITSTSAGIKLNIPENSPLYIDSNNKLQVNKVYAIDPTQSRTTHLTTEKAVKDYVMDYVDNEVISRLGDIEEHLAALEAAAAENGWTV